MPIDTPPAIISRAPAYVTDAALDRLLWAIACVESSNHDDVIGTRGEIGRYQCLPSLWRETTSLPISLAIYDHNAKSVAMRIMHRRTKELRRRGVAEEMIPEVLVQDWECGEHGAVTPRKRDAISRILNLYHS